MSDSILAVNGVEFPLRKGSGEPEPISRVASARAQDDSLRETIKEGSSGPTLPTYRRWRCETPEGDLTDAEAASFRAALEDADGFYLTGRQVWTPEGVPRGRGLTDRYDFSAGSGWDGSGDFAISTATSHFTGRTAYSHTYASGVNGANRNQAIASLPTYPFGAAVVLEVSDLATVRSRIGVRDVTAGDYIGIIRITDWSTLTTVTESEIQGTVTDHGAVQLPDPPNGTRIAVLHATFQADNPGNAAAYHVFPAGDASNLDTAIIHRAEFYPPVLCIRQGAVEVVPGPLADENTIRFTAVEASALSEAA